MTLKTYKQKRDFKKTPEPKGKVIKNTEQIFVIQKHAASHLHYDFRLAIDGVLKSWAVPKGPCLDPSVKRLAIEVEDHPLEYASFEGVIPKGEYGGGTVMIWDFGTWESDQDLSKACHDGHMHFTLHGKKLSGAWKLIRTKNAFEQKPQWFLIKAKDSASKKLSQEDVTDKDLSALSDKNMDEISQANNIYKRNQNKKNTPSQTKLPDSFKPQLATLVKTIPQGSHWLHEVKFDGYRILAFIEKNSVKLISRNGQNWTQKFPTIAKSIQQFSLDNTILDGELVALDSDGHSDFQLLQNSINQKETSHLHYFVFDAPFLNGENLTNTPLIKRKEKLAKLFVNHQLENIHYSNHVQGHNNEIFKMACQKGLEGVISKRSDSIYQQTRCDSWIKVKCMQRQEFVIVGYTKPQGTRKHFGSLLIAYYDDNKQLTYCGHVGTGFTQQSLNDLYKKLSSLKQGKSPLAKLPSRNIIKNVDWVKPLLIAEVEFIAWTDEGYLRHPSFKGLREDKPAKEITQEKAKEETIYDLAKDLTHPDKVLYKTANISKLQLAEYYLAVADRLLPHIVNRPLTLVRCPATSTQKCFYQKHWAEGLPEAIEKVCIEEKNGRATYTMINTRAGLLAAAQLAILELHPWGSQQSNLDQPDRIIFDLDPAPNIPWETLHSAAVLLHDALSALDLKSYPKLTGGKGLHLVIPIKPEYDFEIIKSFTKAFAVMLEKNFPHLFIANMSKQKRQDKIFIDYFRNDYGATAIAPFSPRSKPEATIAVPVSWEKLDDMQALKNYTIMNWENYVNDYLDDPWRDFFTISQRITQAHLKALKIK